MVASCRFVRSGSGALCCSRSRSSTWRAPTCSCGCRRSCRSSPRRRSRLSSSSPVSAPAGNGAPSPDPGPQQRDLDELGWQAHTVTVGHGDAELVLRPGAAGRRGDRRVAGRAPRGAGRARARPPRAGGDRERRRAPSRCSAPPREPGRRRTRTRLLQALAVLALFAGLFFLDTRARALAAPLRVGARRDRRRARPAGLPDRRASGRRDLRRLGPTRRLRPGRRRAGGGRRPPCVADAADLLPALPDPPQRARQRPGARDARSPCSRTRPGTCTASRARRSPTASPTSPVSGSAEALGLSPSTARQLMREQLADNPSDFADSPQYIVPSGCSARRQPRPAPRRRPLPLSRVAARRAQSVALTTAVATTRRLSRKRSSSSAAASPSDP